MNAAGRLVAYAAGLAVAFTGAFLTARAVIPSAWVQSWTQSAQGHGSDTEQSKSAAAELARGLATSQDGFLLSAVEAPAAAGQAGALMFTIQDAAGGPVVDFETAHEKQLHLIVVRSDGSEFRHAHPSLDIATGTWQLPWQWDAAGTYRVYADFVPRGTSDPITLSRTVEVAGEFTPAPHEGEKLTDSVDGFDLTLSGGMVAGTTSELAVTVSREGQPVTTLQPYLGAFGHLVALREGDLAYLHIHAGDGPAADATAGPSITFGAEVPTAGRYLLYLDFQVGGTVHTARFVVDASRGGGEPTATIHTSEPTASGHDSER